MAETTLKVFHTQEHSFSTTNFPKLAQGNEQWLGDGYYFWQDEHFAEWWGKRWKCGKTNLTGRYTIFSTTLTFDSEDFIDTVFNETDYYEFVDSIEKFAKEYQKVFGKKPILAEFNEFISYFDIWTDIKIIRFQDLPENQKHLEVIGFYYKKRIQIRVNDPTIIKQFTVLRDIKC